MRKGGPSYMIEDPFKVLGRGELNELGHTLEGEEESNFVKNLQRGSRRFRGKLPFKCFACGRVGHYAAKCPHKYKLDKRKESTKWNIKQSINRKSYYTHEDSNGLSNSDEDENNNDYRLLMAFEDDDFLDALDEYGLDEEISKLKICLEEKNIIIDTLTFQLAEREKHNEKLECEVVGLRKYTEKKKALNLRFSKGSENLDEIINVNHSPLIKIGLGYTEEASQTQKLSTSKSYLDAARRSEQFDNRQQRHKANHQVNQVQSTSRMNISYDQPQVNHTQSVSRMNHQDSRFNNCRNYFNGQCFSCHKFGHNATQCVAYKTIMTREARNQRNVTRIMKRTYNNFSPLENEKECSICNNFGHVVFECRSKFRETYQKEKTSLGPKTWKKKEPQTKRCGIALYTEKQENQ